MKADCWELDGETAGKMNPSLCGFNELRNLGMTRVETGVRVDDANERPRKRIFAIAGGFDKNFPQEQREMRISV